MNCKLCNAELEEDALFCHSCGAKVENIAVEEDVTKVCQCGAEISPGVKFCSQCGAAVMDGQTEHNAGMDNNTTTDKPRSFIKNIIENIKAKPKFYGIIGAVILVLIVGLSIGGSVLNHNSKPAKTSTTSSSSTSKNKSTVYSDDVYETIATTALYKEVQKKYKAADAGSTKYKINKTEKKSGYTIVYGKLYLYDKYGKATTGHSDNSGSYIRTFEVKIKDGSSTASSCTIK